MLYPCTSSSLHLEFCNFARRSLSHLTSADTNLVTEIFTRLLSDTNSCILQQGYECFEYLTQSCPDANLLASVAIHIRNAESEVSITLPAYVSYKIIHKLYGFYTLVDFFKELSKRVFRNKSKWFDMKNKFCKQRKTLKTNPVCKKIDDVETRARSICKDLEDMEKLKEQLTKSTWEMVKKTCQKILDGQET